MNPTILMYNFDKDKARKIQFLCLQMKFRIKTISKEDYLKPIGLLLNSSKPKEEELYDGDGFSQEMLVMSALSDNQLNTFLMSFKKQNIPFINLKAIVTPDNISWNSIELYQELTAEHEAISNQAIATKKES